MAIKEFQIGPLEYVEGNYFDGDYTQPNVSKFYLQCDIDGFKGGRVIAGEFFTDNYIDGTYIHSNTIRSSLSVEFDVIVEFTISVQDYMVESYFEDDYTRPQGSRFTLTATPVFTEYFEIALVSQFTTSTSANITAGAAAEFTSTFTQTAVGSRGQDIDMFAFSDAAIAVQVNLIRDNNIAASSAFDVATDFVVSRSAEADVSDLFSAIINGLRSRDVNLETQAAFSFDATAEATKPASSDLSLEASVSITVEITRDVSAALASEFAQDADGNRVRFASSDSTSEFTVSATARQIRDAHLTAFDAATLTATANVVWNINYATPPAVASLTALAGRLETAQSQLPVVAILKGAADRGIVMRSLLGLLSANTAGSGSGRPGDSIVNNALYINSTQPGSAGIISAETQPNVFTIGECWDTRNYAGQYDVNIRFKFRIQNSTSLAHFIYAGSLASSNYWSFSYSYNGNNRGLTFTSYDISRGVNATHIYQTPDLTSAIYNQWLDVEFYAVNANRPGLSGTQRYCYFKINGTTYGPLSSIFGSNGGSTDHFWGTDLSSGASKLVIRNSSIDTLMEVDDLQINIKQNQSGSTLDNQFRKVYLPFTGNYYDWNSAVQQSASSALASQFVLQGSLGGPQRGSAGITSAFAVTAIIGKLNEINLVALDDAELVAQVSAIRDGVADNQFEFSASATASITKDVSITQSSEFNISIDADKIRFFEAAIDSLFEQTASASRITENSSAITAEATVTAIIGTIEDINLVAFTDAAISAQAVKTTDTASNVNAAFEQTTAVNVIAEFVINTTSEVSLSADNERIRDINSDFSALASTVILANEIQGISANFSSRFTTLHTYFVDEGYYVEDGYLEQFETRVSKIANGVADLEFTASLTAGIRTDVFVAMTTTSSASVTADVVKTTDVVVLEVSESTLSSVPSKFVGFESSVQSQFTIFCNAVTAGEINMVAFTNASLSATPEANKPFDSNLSSQFTVYAYTQDSLNSVGEADIASEFTTDITANFIADNVIQTEAIASALTVAIKDVAVDTVCEINAILFADAQRTRSVAISTTSSSVFTATAVKITDNFSAFENQANIEANVVKVVSASITTESIAINLTAAVRLAGLFIECQTSVAVSATGVVTRSANSDLSSVADVYTMADALINFNADIESTASVSAIIGSIKPASSSIASAMAFAVEVRELRLEEIIYIIPAEGWNYTITAESRNYKFNGETRIRSITGESRERTITGESRIHIIE